MSTMTTPLLNRIAAEHAAALAGQPATPQALAHRRAALQALVAQGLPTTRDENWRYANLRTLDKASFTPAAAPAAVSGTQLPAAIEGFARVVFVDGQFAPQLSVAPGAIGAATLARLRGEPAHQQSGIRAPERGVCHRWR